MWTIWLKWMRQHLKIYSEHREAYVSGKILWQKNKSEINFYILENKKLEFEVQFFRFYYKLTK